MSEVGETLAEPDPPSIATEAGGRRSIKIDLLQSAALISFARVVFWCFVELMFPVLFPGQDWATRATSRPSPRASWGWRSAHTATSSSTCRPPHEIGARLGPLSRLAIGVRSDCEVHLHLLRR